MPLSIGSTQPPAPSSESGRPPAVPPTMEALVVLEPTRFEIQEVPVPEPGPGEVGRLRVYRGHMRVLAERTRRPAGSHAPTGLPCFGGAGVE